MNALRFFKIFRFKKNISTKKQKGFNLLEVMIALAIGAVIIAGILQIFVSNKQTYRTMNALAGLQENARFALMIMGRAIRETDNFLCRDSDHNVYPSSYYFAGSDGGGIASDSITIVNILEDTPDETVSNISHTPTTTDKDGEIIHVNSTTELKKYFDEGNIFIIFDNCNTSATNFAWLKQINSIQDANTITLSSGDGFKEDRRFVGGKIHKLQRTRYFVQNNSLIMWDLNRNVTHELLDGVENMQITYGIDQVSSANKKFYLKASDIANTDTWWDVSSIRINLLMATEDNISSKNLSYKFIDSNGATTEYNATDKRIRKLFTTTIALRNRVP
ncbi:MAG: PilW family protein [Pseudomonadota bacterium]